ncbi:MAG: phosphoserine transaminase [Dongiaceae bacterium]
MQASPLALKPVAKPMLRPSNPCFGSGPTAKRPGWSPQVLEKALAGRSHRSKEGYARIQYLLELSRNILKIPDDYLIALVPGSDTGAIEMALWGMIGPRGVDVLAWDKFGELWVHDIVHELKIKDVRTFKAPYGELPDLKQVDTDRDVVFTWTGTTTGVCVPDGAWIYDKREGLTICDATAAVFAVDLPWDKLDVTTYSWQKVLGGEGAHGMLILSPRAVERIKSYTPPWPMPRLFRLMRDGNFMSQVFDGSTINTPSMLCVEDCIDVLEWIQSTGGLASSIKRSKANLAALSAWIEKTHWVDFYAKEPSTRASTAMTFNVIQPGYRELEPKTNAEWVQKISDILAAEGAAYDIHGHKEMPPHLRIWGGTTVETKNIEILLPWLEWAYQQIVTA